MPQVEINKKKLYWGGGLAAVGVVCISRVVYKYSGYHFVGWATENAAYAGSEEATIVTQRGIKGTVEGFLAGISSENGEGLANRIFSWLNAACPHEVSPIEKLVKTGANIFAPAPSPMPAPMPQAGFNWSDLTRSYTLAGITGVASLALLGLGLKKGWNTKVGQLSLIAAATLGLASSTQFFAAASQDS